MRKPILTLALAFALGWGSLAAARETPEPGAKATDAIQAGRATAETTVDIDGEVVSVDLKNHALQIRDKTGNVSTAVIGPRTAITRNGKSVKLRRVRKGDVVDVDNAR